MQSRVDEIEISMVPPWLLMEIWPKIVFHFRRGAEVAGMGLAKQMARVANGDDCLWVIADCGKLSGTFVTTLCEEDGESFVGVSALSGYRPSRWAVKLCDLMVDYARAHRCSFVRCYGRAAWQRLLPDIKAIGSHENGHDAYFERVVS